MAFEVPLMMIQQTIATGPKKAPLLKMRESHVKNFIEQCTAFVYQVDNMVRQSIDSLFGGNLYPTSTMNKALTGLLLVLLVGAWIYFIVRTVMIWRQDNDYQYYYHEEAKFYMLAFKWIAPILLVIPLLGLGFGMMHESKPNGPQPAVMMQANKQSTSPILDSLKHQQQSNAQKEKSKKSHFGSMADSDSDFVNQMVAAKKAKVATYTELQAGTNVETNKKHLYSLVRYTEPHFKLEAYQNQKQISVLIFMAYALIFSDFFMLVMVIWHDNSSADQW